MLNSFSAKKTLYIQSKVLQQQKKLKVLIRGFWEISMIYKIKIRI